MITKSELNQFSGTEHYYKHLFGRLVYTDGVQYLAENAGAYWLIDAIASYQGSKQLSTPSLKEFQLWELKKVGKSAILTCKADSGVKPAVSQEIEFTDFPLDEIKLYCEQGGVGDRGSPLPPCPTMVLMLPSER